MYTVIVTGSRHYKSSGNIEDVMITTWRAHNHEIFVKVGDCSTGVDNIVRRWCHACIGPDSYQVFEADWTRYRKKAGPIRNHTMIDSGGDICYAWPLEDSRGTKDCAEYAKSKDMPVWFPDLPSWAQWAAPIAQFRD